MYDILKMHVFFHIFPLLVIWLAEPQVITGQHWITGEWLSKVIT